MGMTIRKRLSFIDRVFRPTILLSRPTIFAYTCFIVFLGRLNWLDGKQVLSLTVPIMLSLYR